MNSSLVAGVDEAGRGCLLGPVFAASVIWDDNIEHHLLKDSKQLTKHQREIMFDFILDNCIDYGISSSNINEIDNLNILQATQLAMHRSLNNISLQFDHILVDGNYFNKYNNIHHTCIIKGDTKYKCISAASILAKVSHDSWIVENSNKLLHYDVLNNMGYGTKTHINSINIYGLSEYHRKSFKIKHIDG